MFGRGRFNDDDEEEEEVAPGGDFDAQLQLALELSKKEQEKQDRKRKPEEDLAAEGGLHEIKFNSETFGGKSFVFFETAQFQSACCMHRKRIELTSGQLLAEHLHKGFLPLYNSGQFSDITLLIGDEKFPAHRVVLCTWSQTFKVRVGVCVRACVIAVC